MNQDMQRNLKNEKDNDTGPKFQCISCGALDSRNCICGFVTIDVEDKQGSDLPLIPVHNRDYAEFMEWVSGQMMQSLDIPPFVLFGKRENNDNRR